MFSVSFRWGKKPVLFKWINDKLLLIWRGYATEWHKVAEMSSRGDVCEQWSPLNMLMCFNNLYIVVFLDHTSSPLTKQNKISCIKTSGPHTGAPGDSQLVDDAQTDTSWGSVRGRLSSKNCWAHFQLLQKLLGILSTLRSWKSGYTWFWKAKWLEYKPSGCSSNDFNVVHLYN